MFSVFQDIQLLKLFSRSRETLAHSRFLQIKHASDFAG